MSSATLQKHIGPYGLPEVLIDADAIHERIVQLGAEITESYQGQEVTLLGILKGSFLFMADLARVIDLPVMTEFMGISSYGDKTHSTGEVRIINDMKHPIAGLNVLIIEDIVDTGLTMQYLYKTLQVRKPKSLKLCSLLHKPDKQQVPMDIDFLGFTIEDHFVVGYGLDYEGLYRNLNYIGYFPEDPRIIEGG